jgi:hypothetical protein
MASSWLIDLVRSLLVMKSWSRGTGIVVALGGVDRAITEPDGLLDRGPHFVVWHLPHTKAKLGQGMPVGQFDQGDRCSCRGGIGQQALLF